MDFSSVSFSLPQRRAPSPGTEQIEKHIVKGASRGIILCNVPVTVGDAALEMGSLFP